MSIIAMAWAKQRKTGSASAKLVLLVLADYADEHGSCWPSRSTIAEQCELTIRSVADQLKHLEALGLITRDQRLREDGSHTSTRFKLQLESLVGAMNVLPGGVQEVPGGVQEIHPRVKDVPGEGEPRSLRELPLEPIELGTIVPVASASPDAPERPSRKTDPWTEDPEFLALWQAATPEMRRRAKSMAKVWPEWRKARGAADAEAILAGMLGYRERDPDVGRTGGPGLHIWLRDRTWEAWSGDSEPAATATWTEDHWSTAVDLWRKSGRWGDTLGPAPGEPSCRVPAHLLIEPTSRMQA